MFAAPPELTLDVWTELPAEFHAAGRESDWFFGKDHKTHSFLEGPTFDQDGHLWVSDIPFGRLFRISPEGAWALAAEYDGEPNGLAFDAQGRLFIADHRRGLMVIERPSSGEVRPHLPRVRREGFRGLNDLMFDRSGDLYFTDQGQSGLQDLSGRLYRLRQGAGQLDCVLEGIPSPNGLALSPDERHLLLAVTRANQVWRLPIHPDGTTSKVAAFIQLSGGFAGPDGLAMHRDGRLAVAHCGLGTVWLFSRLGEPLLRLRSPRGLSTTNLCFGGASGHTLYVTESDTGTILRAEIPDAPS
jgi:gluconolactonase